MATIASILVDGQDPSMPALRAWLQSLAGSVSLAAQGIATVATTAARDAFYAIAENQSKLVYVNNNNGSATDPANGVYEYVGGAPRMAQSFYEGLASIVRPLVERAEAAADDVLAVADQVDLITQAVSVKPLRGGIAVRTALGYFKDGYFRIRDGWHFSRVTVGGMFDRNGNDIAALAKLGADAITQPSASMRALKSAIYDGMARRVSQADPIVWAQGAQGAAPTIAGTTIAIDDPRIRYLGGRSSVVVKNDTVTRIMIGRTATPKPGVSQCDSFGFEFVHSGATSFEIALDGNGSPGWASVEIDGVLTNLAGYLLPPNTGFLYWIKITLPDAAAHRVRVWTRDRPFGGLRVANAATVTRPAPRVPLTVIFFGDSETEGVHSISPTDPVQCITAVTNRWSHLVACRLGADNYVVSGVGGTGYVARGPNNDLNPAIARIGDIVDAMPAGSRIAIVDAMGRNDVGLDTSGHVATAQAASFFWQQLRAALPEVPIFKVGPFWTGNYTDTVRSLRDKLFAAGAEIPRFYPIDIENVITDANAAQTEALGHANDAGNFLIGTRVADQMIPYVRGF